METKHAKDLKPGEFFKLRENGRKVYAFGYLRSLNGYVRAYDRRTRKYLCTDPEDISRDVMLSKSAVVFTGFEY